MPIISVTPAPTQDEKTCSECQLNCKHKHDIKDAQTILTNSDHQTPEQKRTTSLVSRKEDDFWVDISDRRLRNSGLGALYGGSQFKGVQKCGTTQYEVLVDIQVNRHSSLMQ
jgi:hypothetical protein